MEFLPLELDGQRVYVGFWKRLGAGLIDALVLVPVSLFANYIAGLDRMIALVTTVPTAALFAFYHVFMNAMFGGSVGKLVVGIRIAQPDGSKIEWRHAWWRSSVDLLFSAVIVVSEMWILLQIDSATYSSLTFFERNELYQQLGSTFYIGVGIFIQVWIWSELLVLLFNKRKRALHDFIGGTVVIDRRFLTDQY